MNRLRIADGDPEIFTGELALEAIYGYSKGIPRVINVLGDNALVTAYALGKKHVDQLIISEVAEDLSLSKGTLSARQSYPIPLSRPNGAPSKPVQKVIDLAQPVNSQPVRRARRGEPSKCNRPG